MRRLKLPVVLAVLSVLVLSLAGVTAAGAQQPDPAPFKALVFSKTAGFRHDSIPAGIAAIRQLGQANDFTVDATEDAGQFTAANLAQYDVVIFLSTTGDVLDEAQQAAFEGYIREGGGYAGIHAAADTEYDWPWYGGLVGAYFASHPPGTPTATVDVLDQAHPSTAPLPQEWQRTDEWYDYRTNPRGQVHVLATLEESSYTGGVMGADHPIAWCQDYDGGRSWYTGGGHTQASFSEPLFRQHILGGIQTAAGVVPSECGGTVWANYDPQILAQGATAVGEPMSLAVLPDRRVLTTSRDGRVFLHTPGGQTTLAATVPVYTHDEDGLQGIGVDPDFEENGWVYLYYSPPLNTPGGDAPENGTGPESFAPFEGKNYLSRFKLEGSQLNLQSEQKILEVDQDRGICCHNGGDIAFDGDGNLLLSTGDDTNPFQSSGYSPIDERLTRNPSFDGQRSSANTNDLRGKLLRIRVNADGSYTSPAGNLFSGDSEPRTRPEIYAMGFRNPFRLTVDPETNTYFLGDYGPDAGGRGPAGPGGMVEFIAITEPGNYGWPHCHGPNAAYTDWNFATGQPRLNASGQPITFDCAGGPVNDSPRNDGVQKLPPAKPATMWYGDAEYPQWHDELGAGGSESPMGGAFYNYDADNPSETKFPASFDKSWFIAEYGRGWIKQVKLQDGNTEVLEVSDFLPNDPIGNNMDLEFGPDGALYVLDYGTGFFGGTPASKLVRIDYVKGTRSPIVEASVDRTSGQEPLTVRFSSEGTRDPDPGQTLTYSWDFGDGQTSTDPNPTHTYTTIGTYNARLTVTDPTGKTGTRTIQITVGNTAPEITLELPAEGGFYEPGDVIRYRVRVTDAEDGAQSVDCSKVEVTYILGHDQHGHPLSEATGCEGTLTTPSDPGHEGEKIFGIIAASYTDAGAPGAPALTGTAQVIIQPKVKEAEHFDDMSGVQIVDAGAASGGQRVGYIDNGDWIAYEPVDLRGIDSIVYRVTSGGGGGTITVRSGSPTGPVVSGPTQVNNTGGWETYATLAPVPVTTDPGGSQKLYFVFSGGFDVDSITFEGAGLSGNARPVVSARASTTRGEAPLAVDFTATATDAEGTALTYAWDFTSDGTVDARTLNASHTYTEPGAYTATFTATDAAGQSRSATVRVIATRALGSCLAGGSDTFDGTSLDRTRWTRVVRETNPARWTVEDGGLTLPTAQGDMYGGTTNAQNLILQPAPEGAWQATVRLNANLMQAYQQGGLILYDSDAAWVKMPFIRYPSGRAFEFISQRGTTPRGGDEHNEEVPGAPDEVWVRITSDGTNVTGSYSLDGVTFVPVGLPAAFDDMVDPHIGIYANDGAGAEVDVTFEEFQLTTGGSDEFDDGPGLDTCRWSEIVRGNEEGYRVEDGHLVLPTVGSDLYGNNNGAPNLILKPAPAGAWTAVTKMTFDPTQNYQKAGLLLYGDDDNWLNAALVHAEQKRFEFILETDGTPRNSQGPPDQILLPADFPTTYWLRMTSDGTNAQAAYSLDGTTWTDFGRPADITGIENPRVGLFALRSTTTAPDVEARFDFFRLTSGGVVEPPPPPPPPADCDEPYTPEAGYRMLFDGSEESLENWKYAGGGSFEREGCAIKSVGAFGLLYTEEEFEAPYSLKLQWMMAGDDNSGIFVGFPDTGANTDQTSISQGEEIQIDATDNPAQTTGAIYLEQAPDIAARESVLNPPGEWNDYEIVVREDRIIVFLNGTKINEWIDDDPNVDLASGHIGLQTHGAGDDVFFRNIRVRDLDEPEEPGEGAPTVQGFADPASGPAPLRVRFSATGLDPEGGALRYRWDFGDEGAALTPTAVRTYRTPGTYTATVTVTDEDGMTATDEVQVVVGGTANGAPTVEASADVTSGPAPMRVRMRADAADDGPMGQLTYEWSFGDGQRAFGRVAAHRYMEPGTYTATVTVTDAEGAEGTDTVQITVAAPPANRAPSVQAAADPPSGAAPLRVRLTSQGTDPDGGRMTYEWDFGDGSPMAAARNGVHTYTRPGTYTATVTVTDEDGATGTARVQIVVSGAGNTAPTVQAAADPSGGGTAPMRVRFTSAARDADGDRVSTVWDFGDGVKAGGPVAVHTYTTPGVYTATVTVTDPSGDTGTATMQVTVTAPARVIRDDAGDVAGETASQVKLARSQKVRTIVRRGLRYRVTCAAECRVSSELRVNAGTARKLGLAKARRVGRAAARTIAAGESGTVVVKVERSVRRQLVAAMRRSGVRTVKATVLTTVSGADGTSTLRRKLTLRR